MPGQPECSNILLVKCEWDEHKSAANKAKHGFSFEDAERFDWYTAITDPDVRKDYGEDREIAIGCLDRSICVLVYTKRGGIVRIISLRKANKRERKHYEEAA